jgi:hypothetical protein
VLQGPNLPRCDLHFYHPYSDKLYQLLRRANPENTTTGIKALIEDIDKACTTYQRFTPKPQAFQVAMPSGFTFNEEVALDIMYLEQSSVLHVVDTQTHFNSAIFLRGESVEMVWIAFLECWATLYAGYLDKMRTDQGAQFTSPRWKELTDSIGIELVLSGVESHNSIGLGERYHGPLRRIYQKVRFDFQDLQTDVALRISVKAMNDTMNYDGLVPSLLVFGIMPRYPGIRTELPAQAERMRALDVARTEMETITCELRLRKALTSSFPPASSQRYEIGEKI